MHLCMWEEVRGKFQELNFITLCLSAWRQGLYSNLDIVWHQQASEILCLHPMLHLNYNLEHGQGHLLTCVLGSELRSSGLGSKHFTHLATFPASRKSSLV